MLDTETQDMTFSACLGTQKCVYYTLKQQNKLVSTLNIGEVKVPKYSVLLDTGTCSMKKLAIMESRYCIIICLSYYNGANLKDAVAFLYGALLGTLVTREL